MDANKPGDNNAHTPNNGPPPAAADGYERADVNPASVLIAAVILFGGFGLISFVLYFLAVHYQQRPAESDPRSESRLVAPLAVPPEPRLQVSPQKDMQQMLADQNAALNSYGWVNRKAGVVRIPIDKAIGLVAEFGYPLETASTFTAARNQEVTTTAQITSKEVLK